jgi:hypothetical protein
LSKSEGYWNAAVTVARAEAQEAMHWNCVTGGQEGCENDEEILEELEVLVNLQLVGWKLLGK